MKNLALVAGLFVGLALSLLTASPAQAGNRPYGDNFQQTVNGERTRDIQGDGGALLLFANDGGQAAQITVEGGGVYLFENTGTSTCLLCTPQPSQTAWDGGCNNTVGDMNYGQVMDGGSTRLIVLQTTTTSMTARPVNSANCSVIPWRMR